MDFDRVEKIDDGIVIKDVKNFNLKHIFECGQCFRWNKCSNGNYIGVAYGKVIELEEKENDIIIYNATESDFLNIWCEYFDLYRDYSAIKQELDKDPILHKSVKFGYGIRLLKQEPFETLISFIISANNRIPRIKKAVDTISKKWGKKLIYKDKEYFAFPTIEELKDASLEELESCGIGFRAKYIENTVKKIYNSIEGYKTEGDIENYNIYEIKQQDDDECFNSLKKFLGVGPKVADCVMLFSMQKYSAFPVDVWVKRAMQKLYLAPDVSLTGIRVFAREKFGELSGFVQQYLFYYARENNLKV